MVHNGKVLIYDYDTLLQRNFLARRYYPDIDWGSMRRRREKGGRGGTMNKLQRPDNSHTQREPHAFWPVAFGSSSSPSPVTGLAGLYLQVTLWYFMRGQNAHLPTRGGWWWRWE